MLIINLVGICLGVEVKRENNKIIPYIVLNKSCFLNKKKIEVLGIH